MIDQAPLSYTDHDLLIRIDTRMEGMVKDLVDLKNRVTELERASDRQKGFIAGGKAFWAFLGAIPAGVLVWFFGNGGINK